MHKSILVFLAIFAVIWLDASAQEASSVAQNNATAEANQVEEQMKENDEQQQETVNVDGESRLLGHHGRGNNFRNPQFYSPFGFSSPFGGFSSAFGGFSSPFGAPQQRQPLSLIIEEQPQPVAPFAASFQPRFVEFSQPRFVEFSQPRFVEVLAPQRIEVLAPQQSFATQPFFGTQQFFGAQPWMWNWGSGWGGRKHGKKLR